MSEKQKILQLLRERGRADARALRAQAGSLRGAQLIAAAGRIPEFDPGRDYSAWPIGAPVRAQGQVYALKQPHNAADYTGTPATLPVLWSLVDASASAPGDAQSRALATAPAGA